MTNYNRLTRLVIGGLMAALVFLGSMLRITLPVNVGTTSFHLGNIMCALSGMILGPVGGGLASGIGSMLYDWTNPLYIAESWITLLTKGAYGVVVGLVAWSGKKGTPLTYRRNVVATVAGALTYAALYLFKGFAWDGLLLGRLQVGPAAAALVTKLPATTFNAVVAIVIAPALFTAIQKALKGQFPRPTNAK
ncbi:MAG TPA: ECF transporter S component [Pseudoflavonifractor sp.]|nr:ECF transporter S component [Pseudoflavonifractor sp.]